VIEIFLLDLCYSFAVMLHPQTKCKLDVNIVQTFYFNIKNVKNNKINNN